VITPAELAGAIAQARRRVSPRRAVLAVITGIDGSGKGYVAAHGATLLREGGLRVAVIGVDGWLNLPSVRFGGSDPAVHFYHHAIRFGDLFAQLVVPLRDRRSIRVEVDHTDVAGTAYQRRMVEYHAIDVVLLEGIFLLKRRLRADYDLSCWITCSFDTALRRAVARAQEGLDPGETERAYRRIYFPAQALHLRRDQPMAAATLLLDNERDGELLPPSTH
jgi:uridine kinase